MTKNEAVTIASEMLTKASAFGETSDTVKYVGKTHTITVGLDKYGYFVDDTGEETSELTRSQALRLVTFRIFTDANQD